MVAECLWFDRQYFNNTGREVNMAADPKYSEGARLERDVMRDYLRRKINKLWDNQSERKVLEDALNWVLNRKKRYDKKKGGLGIV